MSRRFYKNKSIKEILNYGKYNLLVISVICILIDILFLKEFYLLVVLPILVIWILTIYLFEFDSRKIAFIVVLLFIIISSFHIINLSAIAEKAAIWAYLFLIIYAYFLIKADKSPKSRNSKNKNPD